MIYRLVFLSGASKGLRQTVEPVPMVVGTDEGCDIRTDDSEMARRHAVIEQKSDGLWISDLGSMNKILINGRELHKSQLKHGDLVELGRTRFLIQATVQAEYDGPASARVARRRRRRRLPLLIGLLTLTAAGYWWAQHRGSPDKPHPPPGPEFMVAPTQAVVVTETVTNVAFVTNVVVQTAAVENVATPTDSEEFQTVLRELQGLKEMVTTIVVTAKSTAGMAPPPGPPSMAASAKPVAGETALWDIHVRVTGVEQQRFPSSDDYDEMRVLRISLAWRPEEAPDPADRVSLVVAFFEQDPGGSGVVPSRATPPRRHEIPRDAWLRGTSTVITASYVIPKGALAADDATSRVGPFYGYLIRVCRGNEILDAHARPQALLNAEMTALE